MSELRLTEEELVNLSKKADGSDLYFARAIESAVLRKVAAMFDKAEIWQDRPCGCGTCDWCAWASHLFQIGESIQIAAEDRG